MKMNPEVKAKWVAALRSGEYQQTSGQLRDDKGSFCCLGVLCEISGLGQWCDDLVEESVKAYRAGGKASIDIPPHAVLDWAGFEPAKDAHRRIPDVIIANDRDTLSELNDKGNSFGAIADAIEKQL